MDVAGIVLCGGTSRRMGRPKAMLPFGAELMLQRVVRLAREAVEPVVVAAAAGQALPDLPPEVEVVRDRRRERGPLEGIAAGMRALVGRAEAVFVTACDVPLLVPAFALRVIELLGDHDAAVPHVGGFHQPLSAAYRMSVLPQVEILLAADRRRPAFVLDAVRTRRIPANQLMDVDPDLMSLANANSPSDYLRLLGRAGLRPPNETDRP